MNEIVKNLQIFGDDMAMVLLLNVVVGVFSVSLMLFYELSLLLEPYFAWKINRRKSMLKFYPEFQKHMFELKLYMAETKANPISSIDLRIASDKYLLYKSSPEEYRSFFDYERYRIDSFIQSVDKLYQKLLDIEDFLRENGVPRFWLRHCILKRKIMKRIAWIRRYTSYMKELSKNDTMVTPDVLAYEMNSFHLTSKLKLDDKDMDHYFHLLERWFVKY